MGNTEKVITLTDWINAVTFTGCFCLQSGLQMKEIYHYCKGHELEGIKYDKKKPGILLLTLLMTLAFIFRLTSVDLATWYEEYFMFYVVPPIVELVFLHLFVMLLIAFKVFLRKNQAVSAKIKNWIGIPNVVFILLFYIVATCVWSNNQTFRLVH